MHANISNTLYYHHSTAQTRARLLSICQNRRKNKSVLFKSNACAKCEVFFILILYIPSRLISRCLKEQKVKYLNASRAKRLVHFGKLSNTLKNVRNRKFFCFSIMCRAAPKFHGQLHTNRIQNVILVRSPKVHKCLFFVYTD